MKPPFSSLLAADLFALGASFRPTKQDYEEALAGVPVGEPDADFDRWCDARGGERPVTLPTASEKDIAEEFERIARRRHPGTPHEL